MIFVGSPVSDTSANPVEIPYDRVIARSHSQLAICFEIDGKQVWIPKSQITDCTHDLTCSSGDESGEVTIPEWLAIDEGLDGYV